jgi:hypothetical protein
MWNVVAKIDHRSLKDFHVLLSREDQGDVRGFGDSVTRSKVHRALRRLDFGQAEAWAIAQASTVEVAKGRYALPFGFVQSMVLASAVLDLSSLGRCLCTLNGVRRLSTSMIS